MPILSQIVLFGTSFLGSLLQSRAGQLIIVGLVAWFWSAHSTATHWKSVIAQEKAEIERAYKAEVARQQKAAEDIAQAATERADDDARVVADMQAIITNYEKKFKEKAHVTANKPNPGDCVIDDHFSGVVQQLSSAARRTSKAPRAARGVRKAR